MPSDHIRQTLDSNVVKLSENMEEGFFKVSDSPNGQLVVPANPVIVKDFVKQVIVAYASDEEQLRKDLSVVTYSNILPMPIMVSPLYVLLSGVDEPRRLYVNSVDMMLTLRQIYMAFVKNPYMDHFKRRAKQIVKIAEEHDRMVAQRETVRDRQVDRLLEALRDKKMDDKTLLDTFCLSLASFTVDVINYMEIAIMGALQCKAPLTKAVKEIPHMDQVFNDDEKKKFVDRLCMFFTWKAQLMNANLKMTSGAKEQVFFNTADFPRRIRETPPAEIYRGFIDRETLMEYIHYMDATDILL